MNLDANLGPTTSYVQYSDDQNGGPARRVCDVRSNILNAMNLARLNSNTTRYNRLAAFTAQWDVKCGLLRMQAADPAASDSAKQLSLDLASEAAAALAVAD